MSDPKIGIYGLGTMGAALALNMADKGIAIAVSNRPASVIPEFMERAGDLAENITAVDDLKALIDALDAAGPQAERAVEEERFADAMSALASLRKPIDDFFENVTVNDDDETKRTARLGLLARFRNAVHQVADFGKIEG